MRQSIQDGTGESCTSKNLDPLIEWQIGRDDDACSFIGGRDDVEEEFASEFAGRDVPQFVKDQQVQRHQSLLETFECSFVTGFDHLGDQFGDPIKFHFLSELTRFDTEGGCQMRLACSGLSDQDDRFAVDQVGPPHQFVDEHFVQRRLGLEVEALQSFQIRELRTLESSFGGFRFAIQEFPFRHLQQVSEVIDVLLRTAHCDLLAFVFHRREFELFEMMFQKHG